MQEKSLIETLDHDGLSLLLNLEVPSPDAGHRISCQKGKLVTSHARSYCQPADVNGTPCSNGAIFGRVKYPVKGNSHMYIFGTPLGKVNGSEGKRFRRFSKGLFSGSA